MTAASHPRSHLRLVPERRREELERATRVLKARHYQPATMKAYLFWMDRFCAFHAPADLWDLREPAVNAFLTHLAVQENVAASTQNQALAAILFLYDKVLGEPLDRVEGVVRARRPKRIPTVLAREETERVFAQLEGVPLLICQLLYGSGLRLNEALSLRIKDLDFARREISIKEAKGHKDRVTMLPEPSVMPLHAHVESVRAQHQQDLRRGMGRVQLPNALGRKYPNA